MLVDYDVIQIGNRNCGFIRLRAAWISTIIVTMEMMLLTLLLLCAITQCLALSIINESYGNYNSNDNDSCPKIYWNDEFNGETLDTNSTWNVMLGDGCSYDGLCGWGNNKLENYTMVNVFREDGFLVIEARREEILDDVHSIDGNLSVNEDENNAERK